MTCTHCGATLSATADKCFACAGAVREQPLVAAGVLTPLPVAPRTPDSDETVFLSGKMTIDDEATRFEPAPPAPVPVADADTGAGGAIDLEDTGAARVVDPNVTRFVEPAVEDADVTRVVDPRMTRMAAPPASAGRTHGTFPGTRSGAKTTEGSSGPLEVGQAFSSRYHIIRVLG